MNQAFSLHRAVVRPSNEGSALHGWLWRGAATVLVGLFSLASAWAQTDGDTDSPTEPGTAAEADPPSRVGRVSWTEGQVTLRQAPDPDHPAESVESPRNWPVTSGDVLQTGVNARTEVSVGSTLLRLGEDTRVEIVRLDDEALVVRLQTGSLALRVRHDELARGLEVLAGSSRLMPQGAGLFRVDAHDRTLSATAWRSTLQIDNQGHDFALASGQRADFGIDGAWYRLGTPASDRFASWAMNQNDRAQDVAEVSPEMTGVDDLRDNGDWNDHPDYGRIWVPRVVVAGWAPYRYGHWGWVRPWGWTWIDAAPWGFAPFHYGRWVMWGSRWAWAPGAWVARPTYAPAVVGWFGSPGASVSVSIGPSIGWFPLGPREIYAPYFPCTPRYVRHFNYTHVPRIEHAELYVGGGRRTVNAPPVAYRYRDDHRAYNLLPGDAFRHERGPRIVSVGGAPLRVPPNGGGSRFQAIAAPPTPSFARSPRATAPQVLQQRTPEPVATWANRGQHTAPTAPAAAPLRPAQPRPAEAAAGGWANRGQRAAAPAPQPAPVQRAIIGDRDGDGDVDADDRRTRHTGTVKQQPRDNTVRPAPQQPDDGARQQHAPLRERRMLQQQGQQEQQQGQGQPHREQRNFHRGDGARQDGNGHHGHGEGGPRRMVAM